MLPLIKIIGIGSPWGDDQIGLKVVEILKSNYQNLANVHIEAHDRPGIRLLELFNGATIVYLIDAVQSKQTVGNIYRLQNDEIQELQSIISTHDIGVAETLKLGKVLNLLPSTLIFYGIEMNDMKNQADLLSKSLIPAVEELVTIIASEVSLLKRC